MGLIFVLLLSSCGPSITSKVNSALEKAGHSYKYERVESGVYRYDIDVYGFAGGLLPRDISITVHISKDRSKLVQFDKLGPRDYSASILYHNGIHFQSVHASRMKANVFDSVFADIKRYMD